MKMRNKLGKVYPSPSSSSSSSSSSSMAAASTRDDFSVLNLLPVAILALASVLSLEDREVLAYMMTRSMESPNPSSLLHEDKKNNKKKKKKSSSQHHHHKPPIFTCGCFDCYTSYWFRWDSSPNRELIHQAIESFEEHLGTSEKSKKNKNNNNKGKKRDKMARRTANKPEKPAPESGEGFDEITPENQDFPVILPGKAEVALSEESSHVEEAGEYPPEELEEELPAPAVLRSSPAVNDKGLVRKVLPDVVGLFNSRLWKLWSPNA